MNEVVPQNCPFYKGITKCTVFNCMFNIFGVCTKPGSKFKGGIMQMTQMSFDSLKPDIDNIVKIILDGLNKFAYTDDKQVAVLMASKHYAKDGDQPRVEISITEVM